MDPGAHETLARLSDEAWKKLILKLGKYAQRESARLRWRTQSSRELPGGETVDSIVSKAIEKLFSGDRHWDPARHPNIEKFLMDVIDSLLSHLATSTENRILRRNPASSENDAEEGGEWEKGLETPEAAAAWLHNPAQSPEGALLEEEQGRLDDRALEILIDECSGDPVLPRVLQAMFDGHDDASEIARVTGLSSTDVYNATKKLDRRILRVRERLDAERAKPSGQRT